MTAKERFRTVHLTARLNIKAKLSNADRLDLWGRAVFPNPALLMATAVRIGVQETDSAKITRLLLANLTRIMI